MNAKKLLAILAILAVKPIFSEAPVHKNLREKYLDFIEFKKVYKINWLEYATGYDSARMNLVIKHHKEQYDLWKKSMEMSFLSEDPYSDKNLQIGLDAMIQLHEKQAHEWKTLCNNWHQLEVEMGKAEQEELEKQFKPKPEPKEEIEIIEIFR